jgi:hypothetical protein
MYVTGFKIEVAGASGYATEVSSWIWIASTWSAVFPRLHDTMPLDLDVDAVGTFSKGKNPSPFPALTALRAPMLVSEGSVWIHVSGERSAKHQNRDNTIYIITNAGR